MKQSQGEQDRSKFFYAKETLEQNRVALIFGTTLLLLLGTTVFKQYTPVLWAYALYWSGEYYHEIRYPDHRDISIL